MGTCCTVKNNTSLSPVTIHDLKDLEHMEQPSTLSLSRLRVSTQTAFADDNTDIGAKKQPKVKSAVRTSLEQMSILDRPHKLSIDSLNVPERGLLIEKDGEVTSKRGSGTLRHSLLSKSSFADSNIARGSRTSLLLNDPTPNNAVLRFQRFIGKSLIIHKEASDESSNSNEIEGESEEEKEQLSIVKERNSKKSHTTSYLHLKPVLKRNSNVSSDDVRRFQNESPPKRVRFKD